jgi:hypothetical protein
VQCPVVRYGGNALRYGTSVRGYFRDSVQFRTEFVQFHTESVRVGLWVFFYICLIDVNLNYYQNNSRLSVDVDKLPNHVKSVSLSLFDSILCAVITYCHKLNPLFLDELNSLLFFFNKGKRIRRIKEIEPTSFLLQQTHN